MLIAAGICAFFALIFWIRTRTCYKRSQVRDGNTEGFGLFIYVPLAIVTTLLAVLFGVLGIFV